MTDPALPSMAPFAGFWRRVAAFLVDAFVLGFVGHALGLLFYDSLVRLGSAGRCVGFGVALAYFLAQESGRSGGQSLGKRLLRIRVVDAAGRPLSLGRAALRFGVFGVPYFLSGAALPVEVSTLAGGFPLALLSLGGVLALGYLLVFNRRTRQSLHDLAVGAFVVRAEEGARRAPGSLRLWSGHLAIAGVLGLGAGAMPLVFPQWMRAPMSPGLQALARRLAEQPGLRSVNVFELVTLRHALSRDAMQSVLLIQATITAPLPDTVPLSVRLAGIALASDVRVSRDDRISVRLAHGFDIGIAANWDSSEFVLTPSQWQDRVAAGLGN